MATIDQPVTDAGTEPDAPAPTTPAAPVDLEASRTMPEFRSLMTTPAFTAEERELVVQQAATLIEGLYVHLAQKRSMYAIDPGQRLRLLRRRLTQLSDAEFQAQLSRILTELRDLHTVYVRPAPYRGRIAALGILVERYMEGGESHFMVSKASPELTGDTGLVPGAEALHWNGSPMGLAVARNADREAGSNAAARFARGLESLAFRVLALSPPPDEDWVDLRYRVGGTLREARIPWRVYDGITELRQASGGDFGLAGVPTPPNRLLGLDLRTDVVQDVKKAMFAPDIALQQQKVEEAAGAVPEATEAQLAKREIPTTRPNELSAREVTTSHGTFGHLRIFTFHMEGANAAQAIGEFRSEVARLLGELPQDGLIIDVRNNGGGYVYAGESILQYFSPRPIQPEPTQFINTPLTAQLCRKVDFLEPWAESIESSIETGAQYSGGIPLYPAEAVNGDGQLYHGPVVLITDAFCYSTTDFFSAGFQDAGIGKVLGVDDNTGAGGANVWGHADLVEDWPDGPLEALPKGAMFQVALRRSLRVGSRWGGQPVEDLGVIPDVRHHITARDLTEDNADLMEAAGAILAEGTPRTLRVKVMPEAAVAGEPEGVTLGLTTKALTGVDAYVNGRPVTTSSVSDGPDNTLHVPLTMAAGESATIRLDGFDDADLVASRTLNASAE